MTTQIEEWQNKLENIENATPEYRAQIVKKSHPWSTCATGALLCDIIGATPDTIDVKVDNGPTYLSLDDKLYQALWKRDRLLYNKGHAFCFALEYEEYDRAKEILMDIKAYKPNKRLLSLISKRKDA